MSQLIQLVFNEPVPVGDEVYPEGHRMLIPAEQVFGSHARRQLAPFDLFDTGLELVRDLDDGFYRLAYNIEITIGARTLRQSDLFYYELPTALAFGWLTAIVNQNGSFTLRQSDISVLAAGTTVNPGAENTVNLTFFYQGNKVAVTGPALTPSENGTFDLKVTAPVRPGSWQYDVRFNYEGIDYDYPLSLSVLQPGLVITNVTPSMKAGELGLLQFSVERDTLDRPNVALISAAIDGGTPGELHPLHDNVYGLEVTPKDVVFTMNVRLVLSIDGWLVPWNTYVLVTQKDASSEIVSGDVLTFNLTQVVKIRVISEGKPVKTLTTKSLVLSGSPSYHTYAKSLVKVEDGLYQFSIYTNNIAGTMYADIVVTIDGVDLALPRFPITVRA
jgi:hypothetical protein